MSCYVLLTSFLSPLSPLSFHAPRQRSSKWQKPGALFGKCRTVPRLCSSACFPRDPSPLRSHLGTRPSMAVFVWMDSVQDCDGHFDHAHCHHSPAATHPYPRQKNPSKKHNARSMEPEHEFETLGSFQSLSAENEHLTVLDIVTIVRYLSTLSKYQIVSL